jgi:hypothetical protein
VKATEALQARRWSFLGLHGLKPRKGNQELDPPYREAQHGIHRGGVEESVGVSEFFEREDTRKTILGGYEWIALQ